MGVIEYEERVYSCRWCQKELVAGQAIFRCTHCRCVVAYPVQTKRTVSDKSNLYWQELWE